MYNIPMNRSWYVNASDIKSPDAIHQILAFGTVGEIILLKKKMGERALTQLFLRHPKKVYTAASLNFIKTFILHAAVNIDEKQYLKNTLRHLG